MTVGYVMSVELTDSLVDIMHVLQYPHLSNEIPLNLTVDINIIKTHTPMMEAKLRRKIQAESKHKNSHKKTQPTTLSNKLTATRKLSLSFYAEDTLRNHKQIILDNCDLPQDIPLVPPCITESCLKGKAALKNNFGLGWSKQNESSLKMEHFFFEGKCDEIELVPTNASHF